MTFACYADLSHMPFTCTHGADYWAFRKVGESRRRLGLANQKVGEGTTVHIWGRGGGACSKTRQSLAAACTVYTVRCRTVHYMLHRPAVLVVWILKASPVCVSVSLCVCVCVCVCDCTCVCQVVCEL